MLGGIVAVPLIAIASYSTHKKANEIQEETVKLKKIIVEQEKHLVILQGVLDMTQQKKLETATICDNFRFTTVRLIRIIRPFGILSVFRQKILALLRREP